MIGLAVGIDPRPVHLSRHRDSSPRASHRTGRQATGTAGSGRLRRRHRRGRAGRARRRGHPLLSTMGMAAAGSVAAAVLVSLTLLPALLGLGGRRLMPCKVADDHHARHHTGVWAGWVRTVTKVPCSRPCSSSPA